MHLRCSDSLRPLLPHFSNQLKPGKSATHLRCSDSLRSLLSHFPLQLKLGKNAILPKEP